MNVYYVVRENETVLCGPFMDSSYAQEVAERLNNSTLPFFGLCHVKEYEEDVDSVRDFLLNGGEKSVNLKLRLLNKKGKFVVIISSENGGCISFPWNITDSSDEFDKRVGGKIRALAASMMEG